MSEEPVFFPVMMVLIPDKKWENMTVVDFMNHLNNHDFSVVGSLSLSSVYPMISLHIKIRENENADHQQHH